MNIFFRELKVNLKSSLFWCLGIILTVAGGMSKFSAAYKSGQSMNDLMAKMPKMIQALFGIGSFDLSKASGFYGVLFSYLVLIAVIHAALLGASLISKEERDKTSEFLYSKPITRNKIISQKMLASFLTILLITIISLFSSLSMMSNYSQGEPINTLILSYILGLFFMQLFFLALGLVISAIFKSPKTAPSIVSGFLLFFFFLYKLSDMHVSLNILKYMTPFAYFDAFQIKTWGLNTYSLILFVILVTGMVIATFILYKKRDLII